jgi:hypothetical protein
MREEIEHCRSLGPFIAVGARESDASMLYMLAGLLSSDLGHVMSGPDSSASGPLNGAYWYYIPGMSFGFASEGDIYLDPVDFSDTNCENRLSWYLDGQTGGYRAGCSMNLNDNTNWRKIIYSCIWVR